MTTKEAAVTRPRSAQKILLLTVVAIFWFSQYVFMPYQATYLHAIGAAPSLIGMVVGAYGASQMALRIPVGLAADRSGKHRRFILIGASSSGCASLLRVLLPDAGGFLLASLLSGLAAAMWISFMVLFFTYFSVDNLQKASGLIVGANNLGILVGFAAGAALYDRFGIRFLCVLSFLAACLAFFLALALRDPERNVQGPPVRELVRVFSSRRLILFSLVALIQQGIQISTSMSFTTQAASNLGANGTQIGVCSIIYILTAVLSSWLAATAAFRKIGVSFWIPAILACLTLYCILVPNLPSVGWIDLTQILSGLSTGILFSLCTSEAMKGVPEEKHSSAMGFFQAVYALGMTLFPVLTGAVSETYNLQSAFYVLAAIAAAGFCAMFVFYRVRPAAGRRG